MAEFDVSSVTLQRACDDLAEMGLVVARGPAGTFVAERPPHLQRYALLFPNAPAPDGTWSRFYRALESEAIRLVHDRSIEVVCGYELEDRPQSDANQRLVRLAKEGMFAGMLFAYRPELATPDSPLLNAPVAKAAIGVSGLPSIASLRLDQESYAARLHGVLRARGAQRVAVIAGASLLAMRGAALADGLRAAGFDTRPAWMLGVDLDHPSAATALPRLLFAPWCNERPDALVIADDHLEEAVIAGLLAEGVRVGSDLTVVVHANFPRGAASLLPVLRIGYHARSVLDSAIALLDARRRDWPDGPDDVAVPACMEGESPIAAVIG